jgi:hypothetical protein
MDFIFDEIGGEWLWGSLMWPNLAFSHLHSGKNAVSIFNFVTNFGLLCVKRKSAEP